jgi:hypothetical protein
MAVALWAPWKALKAGELQQQELIQRAKSKLKAQDTKIKELTRQLEAKGGPAGPEDAEIDLPADTRAAVDAVEVEAGKAPEPKPAPAAAEDDPEVI